jgi:hypothetical protein
MLWGWTLKIVDPHQNGGDEEVLLEMGTAESGSVNLHVNFQCLAGE